MIQMLIAQYAAVRRGQSHPFVSVEEIQIALGQLPPDDIVAPGHFRFGQNKSMLRLHEVIRIVLVVFKKSAHSDSSGSPLSRLSGSSSSSPSHSSLSMNPSGIVNPRVNLPSVPVARPPAARTAARPAAGVARVIVRHRPCQFMVERLLRWISAAAFASAMDKSCKP